MKQTIATLSLAFILATGAFAAAAPVTVQTSPTTQTPAGQPAAKTTPKKKTRKAAKAKTMAPVKK